LKQSSVRVRDAGDWLDKASSKIRTPGSQGSQFADGSLKLLGQFWTTLEPVWSDKPNPISLTVPVTTAARISNYFTRTPANIGLFLIRGCELPYVEPTWCSDA